MSKVIEINTKQRSRDIPASSATLIEQHIQRWMKEDDATNTAVMYAIRERHSNDGWDSIFPAEWPQSNDIADCMRVTAQKVRRWLRCEHKLTGHEYLDLIRLMVAEMPSTVAASFVTELFSHAGIVAVATQTDAKDIDHLTAAGMVSKEAGEAIQAAINLPLKPTRKELLNAKREAVEVRESSEQLIAAIDQQLTGKVAV